jgi:hypothetical protein
MEKLLTKNSSIEELTTNGLRTYQSHSISMLYLQLALGFKQHALARTQQVTSACHAKPKTKLSKPE